MNVLVVPGDGVRADTRLAARGSSVGSRALHGVNDARDACRVVSLGQQSRSSTECVSCAEDAEVRCGPGNAGRAG